MENKTDSSYINFTQHLHGDDGDPRFYFVKQNNGQMSKHMKEAYDVRFLNLNFIIFQ